VRWDGTRTRVARVRANMDDEHEALWCDGCVV
jgi:hypothetical protein